MATDMVRKHFTIPREVAEEFERLVGERNQSAEITDMMERRLQSERLREAFDNLAASPRGDHPEWEGPGAIAAWVAKLRESWDRDLDLND